MTRTFQTDLELGKEAESKVLDTIRQKYPLAFGVEGKHKAYDIFIPELDIGVEVKNDLQTSSTGNIMIEIECNGQPSGLMATRAKMWAYCFGNDTLWLDTGRVKDMIIEQNPTLKLFTPKGETCTVKAYLVPLDVAKGYRRNAREQNLDTSEQVPFVAIGNGEPVPEHLKHLIDKVKNKGNKQ